MVGLHCGPQEPSAHHKVHVQLSACQHCLLLIYQVISINLNTTELFQTSLGTVSLTTASPHLSAIFLGTVSLTTTSAIFLGTVSLTTASPHLSAIFLGTVSLSTTSPHLLAIFLTKEGMLPWEGRCVQGVCRTLARRNLSRSHLSRPQRRWLLWHHTGRID